MQSTNPSSRARRPGLWLISIAGLALGATAIPASAQNALDRNLQQGSGGTNTRVRDIEAQVRYQNSIVTGNAPGGKAFRDNVGYLAADEFRSTLGSNDLYAFRRDAATSAIPSLGIRGTEALRYQFAVSTGQISNVPLEGTFSVPRSGAGAIGSEVGGAVSGSMPPARSTSEYLATRSVLPAILATRVKPDGTGMAITASPLLGIRRVDLENSGESLPAAPGENATRRPSWAFTGMEVRPLGVDRPGMTPPAAPGGTAAPGGPSGQQMELNAPTYQIDQQRTRASAEVLTKVREALEPNAPAKPTVKPADGQAGPKAKPEGSQANPEPLDPSDWRAKLDDMRRALRGEPPRQKPKPAAEAPDKPADHANPLEPRIPGSTPEDDAARRARIADQRAELQKQLLKPGGASLDDQTVKALKKSSTTVHDLAAPGARNDVLAYSEHMAIGQNLLTEGRYFDAEERFARAIAAVPGDSMAQVGRIHAQIASGLFIPASMNLRNLLKDHPELVATRYDAKLLPPPDRWAQLSRQLRQRLATENAGDSAGLLLAYMGYQYQDPPAVTEGLGAMSKNPPPPDSPDAALLKLLRAVWSDNPPPAPSDSK